MIRVVASDVDGTLLRSDESVSDRTVRALRAVEERGILVVLATARPPRSVRPLVELLGCHGLALCANGALVYDAEAHRVVEAHTFAAEAASEIVRRLRAAFPGIGVGLEQGLVSRRDPHYESPFAFKDSVEVAPVEQFLHEPVSKVYAAYPGKEAARLREQAQALLAGLADVTTSATAARAFLEVMPPGIHKARAVERLVAVRGHGPDETIAFGDMPNDIELLRWAGRGVAVANAHPEVLAAADEVTSSNDDDGVAIVLERLLADD